MQILFAGKNYRIAIIVIQFPNLCFKKNLSEDNTKPLFKYVIMILKIKENEKLNWTPLFYWIVLLVPLVGEKSKPGK